MGLRETFHIAAIHMIENKFRLLLTTLGIIVGAITIILVIAIGKGGEQEAAKQFSNLSADTIYVNLDYTALAAGKDVTTVEKLTPELMEKVMEESTTLQGMYLRASSFQQVSYNSQKQSANLVEVTPGYAEISNISLEQGSDFGEYDFEDGERVAVIGSKIAEKLFGTGQAVGKAFRIEDVEKAKKEIMSTLNYYMTEASVYTVSDAGTRIEAATASATTMKLLLVSVAVIVFVVGGHRHHERDVCHGKGAHQRDRHSEGTGCQGKGYPVPVSAGILLHRPVFRPGGGGAQLPRHRFDEPHRYSGLPHLGRQDPGMYLCRCHQYFVRVLPRL